MIFISSVGLRKVQECIPSTLQNIIEDNEIFFMAPGDGHKIAPGDGEQCWVSILVSERLLELLPEKVANNIRFEVFDTWDKAPVAKMDDSTAEALLWLHSFLLSFLFSEIMQLGTNPCQTAVRKIVQRILDSDAWLMKEYINRIMPYTMPRL